jgi:hypothetical protein
VRWAFLLLDIRIGLRGQGIAQREVEQTDTPGGSLLPRHLSWVALESNQLHDPQLDFIKDGGGAIGSHGSDHLVF